MKPLKIHPCVPPLYILPPNAFLWPKKYYPKIKNIEKKIAKLYRDPDFIKFISAIVADEKQGEKSMNAKVMNMVRDYATEHLDKSDAAPEFDVFVVWQCYILGNAKWLLSTSLPDGMYYEVTFNKAKNEFYLDAYKKFENRCIQNY